MASKTPTSLTFLLLSFSIASLLVNKADSAAPGKISVYWGQGLNDDSEGSLQEACDTGNYHIIILQHLIVHDDGSKPYLNLALHCNDCTELEDQIKYCQKKGIKILLQIGQVGLGAKSEDKSKKLADYLLENFLSGQPGPLGKVSLDGIDIASTSEGENVKFDKLVDALNSSAKEKIYLSASPHCGYPNSYLDDAIQTKKFDYIFVQFFFQHSCMYSKDKPENVLDAWKTWTEQVPESLIFLVLPVTSSLLGYVEPEVFNSEILPVALEASNYGGIGIYNRYYDRLGDYSSRIGLKTLRMSYQRYRSSL